MASPRAYVKNAGDEDQVTRAGRKVDRRQQRRVELLRKQLSTYEGREFVWGELERHGLYDLVSGPMELIYPWLGKREAGILLLVDVMRDHPAAYLEMQREALVRVDRENRETDAAHTASATSGDPAA